MCLCSLLISLSHVSNRLYNKKIIIEYDQETLQSQIADKPMAPRERAKQQSRGSRKTNQAKQITILAYFGGHVMLL